ncbi:MAG: hypothetical protein ACRDL2_06200 [Gaiellaceae bacterium]
MASDLTPADAGISVPVAPPAPAPAPPREARPPHWYRFLLVYGVLGAVLAAAIGGVVIYAGRSINPAPKWSTWHPSGGGLGAAKQVAATVGKEYRLPDGSQLVDVIAKAPSVSGGTTASGGQVPIHYFAIHSSTGGDQIYPVSSSDSVMYQLCGLGPSCSIATGKPSVARGTLVRREVLELALYTFKYVGGVKSIVAFMPPSSGTAQQYAVFLQKSDVESELKAPLAGTLSSKTPLPAGIPAREVHVVDATTESKVYTFGLSQAQTGDLVLVFKPLPA